MKLTIGQYQQLYAIAKSKDDEIDKAIQSVSVLTGKTEREIEEMPYVEFNSLARTVNTAFEKAKLNTNPVSFLKSNGKLYQINYKVASFTKGQYTEVQAWLNGDLIENMDKILASISVLVKRYGWVKLPAKKQPNHQEMTEAFKDVSFNDAYGCIVFFCKIFRSSIEGIVTYSELSKRMTPTQKENLQQTMAGFKSIMDGFTTAKE